MKIKTKSVHSFRKHHKLSSCSRFLAPGGTAESGRAATPSPTVATQTGQLGPRRARCITWPGGPAGAVVPAPRQADCKGKWAGWGLQTRAPQKEWRSACNGDGVYLGQQASFGNTGGGHPIIIKNVITAAESHTLSELIWLVN